MEFKKRFADPVSEKDTFLKMAREIWPHLEAIREIVERYGYQDLATATTSADGYSYFKTHDSNWQLSQVEHEEPVIRCGWEKEPLWNREQENV